MHIPKNLPVSLCLAVILVLTSGRCAGALDFEHVMSFGSEGVAPGQFKYVEDFALDSKGRLLVTDAAHAFVQVFDKTSGEYITRFGGKGYNDENLEKPEGISVAPDGRIFVADYITGEVEIYDADYQWLDTFSEYGSEEGQNIKSEFTDIYNGLYYLPEAGNHRISVFDLQGNFQFLFGGHGTEPGKMNNPEAAKLNSQGMLYESDLMNDRIQIFTPEGKFVKVFGTSGREAGQLKSPVGIGIDKDDNVYVGEIGNNRVQVFDKDGNHITMWGEEGSGTGQFGNIHGVFVDKATGWVYIADTANHRVQVYKPVQ